MKEYKENILWIALALLFIILFVTTHIFNQNIVQLQNATNSLNDIEYLNSNVQRFNKLMIENRNVEQIIHNVNQISSSLQENPYLIEHVLHNEIIYTMVFDVIQDLKEVLSLSKMAEIDYNKLFFASERHFYHCNDLSLYIANDIQSISQKILFLEICLIGNIILIAIFIISSFIKIQSELNRNKELTKNMFVDTATGLYDRSKCQSLFQDDNFSSKRKSKILIVFDLNDLKKTNDIYGHKVGDFLIASFAKLLQEATKIHPNNKPFLGRYGGDEFIVYYSNIDQLDIELYLNELYRLKTNFNEQETKFQISYAFGYAIADKSSLINNFQDLFDLADQNMYANKIEMKKLSSST